MKEFVIRETNTGKFKKICIKNDAGEKDYFVGSVKTMMKLKEMNAVIYPYDQNTSSKRGFFSFYVLTKTEEEAQKIIDEYLVPASIMVEMNKAV